MAIEQVVGKEFSVNETWAGLFQLHPDLGIEMVSRYILSVIFRLSGFKL